HYSPFSYHHHRAHPYLPSFPTRRSSDLAISIHSSIVNPSCSESIVITTYISPIASLIKSSSSFAMPSNSSPNSSPSFNACPFGSAVCKLRSCAHCLIKSVVVFVIISVLSLFISNMSNEANVPQLTQCSGCPIPFLLRKATTYSASHSWHTHRILVAIYSASINVPFSL